MAYPIHSACLMFRFFRRISELKRAYNCALSIFSTAASRYHASLACAVPKITPARLTIYADCVRFDGPGSPVVIRTPKIALRFLGEEEQSKRQGDNFLNCCRQARFAPTTRRTVITPRSPALLFDFFLFLCPLLKREIRSRFLTQDFGHLKN